MPMMPPRALDRRAIQGAVDTLSSPPVEAFFKRHGQARGAPKWEQEQRDWESQARAFARFNGVPAFNANVIADLCARCDLRVEQRNIENDWEEVDPTDGLGARLARSLDAYRNKWQDTPDLIRMHAWRYQVDGHAVVCWWDGRTGIEYGVLSTTAVLFNKPQRGSTTLKFLSDGKVENGTAVVIPNEQAHHVWIPDPEELFRPTSPMQPSIEDLRRYRALARFATRTAESRLAMEGVFFLPQGIEPIGPPPEVDDEIEDNNDIGTPQTPIEDKYYDLASLSYNDNDDIVAIAPALMSYDKDAGDPKWIEVGRGLDPNGIAYRSEAIVDASRPWPTPSTALAGGGVGDANHWSEWLASEKFVETGVNPTMDRITHMDLTIAFLWPRLTFEGVPPGQLMDFRVGYDSTPVALKPDRSDVVLRAWPLGLISSERALVELGFDPKDAPSDADREFLLALWSKGLMGDVTPVTINTNGNGSSSGLPAQPATTTPGPPERPSAPEGDAVPLAASVDVARLDARAERAAVAAIATRVDERQTLDRLQRLRSSLGTRLLAEAEQAYEAALRQAGVRVTTRGKSRLSAGRAEQVMTAVAQREPLRPWLAAVGITELEMLRGSFDTFADRARAAFARYEERVQSTLEHAGLDDVPFDADIDTAVDYLLDGLNAMARRRLLMGDEALLAATLPRLVPRARRPSDAGFDMPGLPDPEELAQAAARLVRNALRINEGIATMRRSATPDEMPEVVTVEAAPTLEERVAAEVTVEPVWQWVHGFYGEPRTVFEPHEALGAINFTTTDRDGDPGLANTEAWPEGSFFAPGDHDGCTCEWVLAEGASTGE